ncbi:esterase/lipase family protein [Nocardioides iriomotensis]|uniref:DUF7379 domain-containing protein n=1 Tax=Nocardioides iriomotensis TaxID=715784 RepID=A0A4Q5JA46_9ACTN|nr:hypothetical protein [Nocardioides iriomotensis]RYU14829.1 hypothetical protein ETU37_02245 [Nocardioides iriomotensis]
MAVPLQPVPVPLGDGVTLEAPGLTGTAELQPGLLGGRSTDEPNATPGFEAALREQDFYQLHAVEVRSQEDAFPTDVLRTRSGAPAMVLRVPDLGSTQPQVLMMVDEAGVVTWHLPETEEAHPGQIAFTVDRTVAENSALPDVEGGAVGAGGAETTDRGLVAKIGSKLLTVLVVPILEKAVGLAGKAAIKAYEDKNRPQGMRWMTPTGFRTAGSDPVHDWSLLAEGRTLLFLHGTASSSHGAFQGLPDATFQRLHTAYGGRVLAFDHHTLSADLDDNLTELLTHLPTGRRIPVDVISHSRGGLVGRAIAAAMTKGDAPLDVRSLVYVATPNDGTPLADPEHIRAYLDRVTTMLNLVPDGPWSVVTDTLSGLLTVIRSLLAGVVQELPGLAVMRPDNPRLNELPFLGSLGATEYAVDVEFEPKGRLLRLVRGVDGLVDTVFDDEPNDIVVPTNGVTRVRNRSDFTVEPARHVALGQSEASWHCAMFSQAPTGEALDNWLAAPLVAAPGNGHG